MRSFGSFLALSGAFTLAACGGDTGPQTVGGIAPPGGSTPTPTPANFLDVTSTTTFDVVGSFQTLDTTTTVSTPAGGGTPTTRVASLYAGNAATVNAPNGSISYNPRDGIFTVRFTDNAANVTRTYNYQDPAHRTQFSGGQFASYQIPNLATFNYLQVLEGNAQPVFFYQRPGATRADGSKASTFVSLAGFSRVEESQTTTPPANPATDPTVTATNFKGERGAFVFGQKTPFNQVPTSGEGTYRGDFLASMVADPTGGGRSTMQWISGDSSVAVKFGTGQVDLTLTGTVGPAYVQGATVPSPIAAGTSFTARGTAQVNLTGKGGFTGVFTQNTGGQQNVGFGSGASFVGVDFASVSAGGPTAGASSIDGGFFGPNAVDVGGNIRIVGGIPDQRVDILGAFTGTKP
ncbi:hypothetical protein FHS95_000673 [Sphingomonas naasensis]|uniref:Transferrin-binding protein B C-lobe/N-lobe beta barrel domain-containing protein n=1 Tax=Sphingomonas naasensis TaxID=1344951 RepID=A0A4S1WS26_9SPHN|nr:hypothetical protein [Sphingomonas naasensis]NIJ19004.1 hypothetical protein [Sphingomonas naasensis]TGX46209.1 hypothetical protein E5A74_03360 [Sphingomonas naasensis]